MSVLIGKLHSIHTLHVNQLLRWEHKAKSTLISGLQGVRMCPSWFQRRKGRLTGTDDNHKSFPIGSHLEFPMIVKLRRNMGKWKLKKVYSGGVLEAVRERNVGALIQVLFLPCQVTLRWAVTSRALVLFFGKLAMWLVGKGIFDKHQRRENFDIFIQLRGRDEDGESVPISGRLQTGQNLKLQ